jgi:hypothetical protein
MASLRSQVTESQRSMTEVQGLLENYWDGSVNDDLRPSVDLGQLIGKVDEAIAALQRLRDEATRYQSS